MEANSVTQAQAPCGPCDSSSSSSAASGAELPGLCPPGALASRIPRPMASSVFFLFSSLMTLLSGRHRPGCTPLSRIFSMSWSRGRNCPHRRQAGRRPGSAEKPCMCNLCRVRKAKAIFDFL